MGQINECCHLPFHQVEFDLNEVKLHWPQAVLQILKMRETNNNSIILKKLKYKQNIPSTSSKSSAYKTYKQIITPSHCFFGYVTEEGDYLKTDYDQTSQNSYNNRNVKKRRSLTGSQHNKENKENIENNYLSTLTSEKINNYGILVHRDKACYMGNFANSKFHGYGTLSVIQTNDKFEGTFEHGKRLSGKYENKQISYNGEFTDDKLTGRGKLLFKQSSDIYQGEVEDGKMHGRGKILYSNGDVYDGSFSNNLYHGEGTYCWSTGEIYKGVYKRGMKHGFGVITVMGRTLDVCWVNGRAEGKPMNYHEFMLKTEKGVQVSKTAKDPLKEQKSSRQDTGRYVDQDDENDLTSIQMHCRMMKTESAMID